MVKWHTEKLRAAKARRRAHIGASRKKKKKPTPNKKVTEEVKKPEAHGDEASST